MLLCGGVLMEAEEAELWSSLVGPGRGTASPSLLDEV